MNKLLGTGSQVCRSAAATSATDPCPDIKQPTSWRDLIKVHPAAALFPMMTADELKVLGKDIEKKGLTSPIAITAIRHVGGNYEYRLLDGRNRLDAMELVGFLFVPRAYDAL